MIQPKTFKELFQFVNPKDLYEVLCFSGINDHRNEAHRKIRRELTDKIYQSFTNHYDSKQLGLLHTELTSIHYEIIVESLQDFYYWSHQFEHVHAHIFQRVQNALGIPIEPISIIMEKVKEVR